MNPIRALGGLARILATLAAAALAFAAGVPAALAAPRPRPPGWNKHPPLSTHPHALAAGGLPGWQITLITAAAVLMVTALAAAAYRLRAARRRAAASPA